MTSEAHRQPVTAPKWVRVAQVLLVVAGVVLVVWAVVGPDQFVVEAKKATEGTKSSTEYDTSLATAVLALGAVFILAGLLLTRVSELTLPGGAGFKLDAKWTEDAKEAVEDSKDADEDRPS